MNEIIHSKPGEHRSNSLASLVAAVPAGIWFAIPFILVVFITKLDFHFLPDEGKFHLRVVEIFAAEWPNISLADYPSASTPLSYLILTLFGKIVGFEIWKLRLIPTIATFLSANIFYLIAKRHRLPFPLMSSFIFLFFPYIFFFGFTIYTANVALLFGLGALYFYLIDKPTLNQLIMGSILATLAIFSRQSFVFIPAGMILYELVQILQGDIIRSTRKRLPRLLVLAIPFILFLPLFVIWGGFTAPFNQAQEGGDWFLGFTPEQVSFFMVFIGVYFLPMILKLGKGELARIKTAVAVLLLILVPMTVFFPFTFNLERGENTVIAGIISRVLDNIGQIFGDSVSIVFSIIPLIIGVVILVRELMELPWAAEKQKICLMLFSFIGLFVITPFVFERYYILPYSLMVLLFYKTFHFKRITILWFIFQMLVAFGFTYWQLAIK